MEAFFSAFWDILASAFTWCLDGLIYVFGYTFYYVFDGLLTVLYFIINIIDVGSLVVDFLAQVSGLPSQLIYLMGQIGFGECLTIISGAFIVRKFIDLIPAAFTRI